jgi:hypothetical protein
MPKNTLILVSFLAIFAALVTGVNIGRKVNNNSNSSATPNLITSPDPTATPKIELTHYISKICGISFNYPANLTEMNIETGGVMLVDGKDSNLSVAVACQKDIPKPAIPTTQMAPITFAYNASGSAQTINGTIYHDASEKDGTPIDKLIFIHPKNKMDIFISGMGENFNTVISSLALN